jgi:hypothetical protein
MTQSIRAQHYATITPCQWTFDQYHKAVNAGIFEGQSWLSSSPSPKWGEGAGG